MPKSERRRGRSKVGVTWPRVFFAVIHTTSTPTHRNIIHAMLVPAGRRAL
jgi:hypothetical protein